MLDFTDGLILYHGSYCEVKKPLLERCARRKDFGQGFYLTTSKDQAIRFLKTSIAKAFANGSIKENQDYGYLSIFQLRPSPELSTYAFDDANVEWLHCVAAHRKRLLFLDVEDTMAKYDTIAGKIADDATNATLAAYLVGAFGIAGSKEADDFCIKQLLPNKLKDQYCFKTTAALDCLHFVESEKIWLKK